MRHWLTYILLSVGICLQAHTWWVGFTDKVGTTGSLDNPSAYLSDRAIQRREKQHIPIDSTDLPVSERYLQAIQDAGCELLFTSRWNNGAVVCFSDMDIVHKLQQLYFVDTVQLTQNDQAPLHQKKKLPPLAPPTIGNSTKEQLQQIGLEQLHNAGFHGQGIRIAIVDNGFYKADQWQAFDKAREQIVFTRDFVSAEDDVYQTGTHGTMVFSTIAGYIADQYQGTATEAEYCLFRTEDDATESIREIDAQVAAFELADSLGADIITTSLGYGTRFDDPAMDITYRMLDGKTMRNSRAATIAARKGMTVCVSMGNEGNNDWHYMLSPADADSILTVGSVTRLGEHSTFSSYGPAADLRTKPDICALGSEAAIISATNGDITYANGTSFSTPIVAGMAACLWSALPELSNMQLIESIVRYASNVSSPDDALGYGIPNAWNTYCHYRTGVEDLPLWERLTDIQRIYNLQGQTIDLSFEELPKGLYIIQSGKGCYKIMKP